MRYDEKMDIYEIPEKYHPIGAWSYFLLNILFAIPIIGQICLIIFALNDSNVNRRSYARSFFCTLIIVAVLMIILGVTGGLAAIAGAIAGKS